MHTGAGAAGSSPGSSPIPPVPQLPPLPPSKDGSSLSVPGGPTSWETGLSQIRKWALEVLSALHSLEERARLPLSDEAYDVQSEASDSHPQSDVPGPSSNASGGSRARISTSPPALIPAGGSDTTSDPDETLPDQDAAISLSFSVLTLTLPDNSHRHIRVWSDADDEVLLDGNDDPSSTEREKWDERIVLGSGWLYKDDIQLEKERELVRKYLDVVDAALFHGKEGERGWKKEKLKPLPSIPSSSSNPTSGTTSPELLRSRSPMTITRGGPGGTGLLPSSSPDPFALNSLSSLSSLNTALSSLSEEGDTESPETAIPKEVTVPDEDLPEWAKRKSDLFGDDADLGSESAETPTLAAAVAGSLRPRDTLSRAHALLVNLLPSALLHILPLPLDADELEASPSGGVQSRIPRTPFLIALSNGQLLCVAYNAGVRKSRKQWGFVNPDSVHDVVGMEAASASAGGATNASTGWTFRRIDNLRLFIA
jgi:hypothetical protein